MIGAAGGHAPQAVLARVTGVKEGGVGDQTEYLRSSRKRPAAQVAHTRERYVGHRPVGVALRRFLRCHSRPRRGLTLRLPTGGAQDHPQPGKGPGWPWVHRRSAIRRPRSTRGRPRTEKHRTFTKPTNLATTIYSKTLQTTGETPRRKAPACLLRCEHRRRTASLCSVPESPAQLFLVHVRAPPRFFFLASSYSWSLSAVPWGAFASALGGGFWVAEGSLVPLLRLARAGALLVDCARGDLLRPPRRERPHRAGRCFPRSYLLTALRGRRDWTRRCLAWRLRQAQARLAGRASRAARGPSARSARRPCQWCP